MKKLFALLFIAGATFNSALAQHETSCSYTVLSGTQTTNLTLSASTKYELRGCYTVANGAKLTIPAGTVIFAEKSSSAGPYIAPGGQIDAQGTLTNPIVFTSDQDPTYRAAGDWDGIVIAGNATNNATSGSIPVSRSCTIAASANNNDADNSGTLQYVQIHYAKSGLILASAGSGTVVDHIEVAYSSRNSYEMLGGKVNMKYAVSLNPKQSDFYASYGYRGNMQFLLGFRKDAAANDAAGSRGLYITNDPSGSTNTPLTRPVVSNMTLIGPKFCNAGTLSSNFQDAVRYDNRGQGAIYNSVLTDWPQYGLNLAHSGSVQPTASNLVQFSYNSMDNNSAISDYNSTSWTSACDLSMADWIESAGSAGCIEAGNQFAGFGTVGYGSSICSSTSPDFRLGTNNLDAPDYSENDLSAAFFNSTFTTRGAFDGSANWVANWTEFVPQDVDYCPQPRMAAASDDKGRVVLAPNPAAGVTYVMFDAPQAGKVRVSVLDKTSGQPIRTATAVIFTVGKQRVALNVSGLRAGSYVVRVDVDRIAPVYGHLMVK